MLDFSKGFLLFLIFLVPGFVFRTVEGQLVYLDKRLDWGRFALGLITRSTFVYLPAAPLFYVGWQNQWLENHPVLSGLGLVVFILVVPAALGLVSGIVRQKQWPVRFFECIRLKTFEQHNIPTAWDRIFSQTDPCWVILTFKDGTKVYGWFGEGSYVSSDPDERDLFISHTVAQGEDDEGFAFVSGTKGVYVRSDDLRSIEFIEGPSANEEAKQQQNRDSDGANPRRPSASD